MSETKKRKPFDMATILKSAVVVDNIPAIAYRGKPRADWKSLINLVMQKGIVRLSEDNVVVGSVLQGIRKEAKSQSIEVVLNTRKVNGKLYVFIQKPIKR